MKVLTVGGGGREHAAVEALYRSGAEIYAVMKNANPGIIKRSKEHLLCDEKDVAKVCSFAKEKGVELAYIGPEAPLEVGIVDALEAEGIKCAAPTKAAARIETSKSFMRELVDKYNISGNLGFAHFDNAADAEEYLKGIDYEIVVKPIGLTGGKGVKVQGEHLNSFEETMDYVNEIFDQNIGGAGVILEERAIGEEFTQMVFVDGKNIVPLPLVQDHKRAYEGDVGPNTGGMGSYTDSNHLLPFVGEDDRKAAIEILQSIVDAMAQEGCPYHGTMYGQFMLTVRGPKIIEINARFGDPEAMNVLPILESSFTDICWKMATGTLTDDVEFSKDATVCKYVVPKGYGVKSESGHEIAVDEEAIADCGAVVYYANVDVKDGKLVTGTSRSVGVIGRAPTLEEAEQNCEKALEHVKCDAIFVRHDIGTRALVQRRVDHMNELRSA
ncbi:MAG: phosphoribosylamine--glycine ligase [Candidatus Methanomethylophilaceae archaeon]|nr:phosphoribosylamine--glycine ligase [Candidatus Methanomethylophilaceae archaeon]MBQ8644067.1 phosphoribosylamine--glycine ligase [Candidatus Methanomethylophilaceae archaeon]MBR2347573.1 phosphoribosylamine--glycine ligase [Candidatus Methanomethylophilaceae archaeon]